MKDTVEVFETYVRGDRFVFSQRIIERDKPTTCGQTIFLKHEESSHRGTNMSDMEKAYEDRTKHQIIRDKEAKIKR